MQGTALPPLNASPCQGRCRQSRRKGSHKMQGTALPPLNASPCQGRCRQSRRKGSHKMQGFTLPPPFFFLLFSFFFASEASHRAKRNGRGCPSHNYSSFIIHYSLKNGCPSRSFCKAKHRLHTVQLHLRYSATSFAAGNIVRHTVPLLRYLTTTHSGTAMRGFSRSL